MIPIHVIFRLQMPPLNEMAIIVNVDVNELTCLGILQLWTGLSDLVVKNGRPGSPHPVSSYISDVMSGTQPGRQHWGISGNSLSTQLTHLSVWKCREVWVFCPLLATGWSTIQTLSHLAAGNGPMLANFSTIGRLSASEIAESQDSHVFCRLS